MELLLIFKLTTLLRVTLLQVVLMTAIILILRGGESLQTPSVSVLQLDTTCSGGPRRLPRIFLRWQVEFGLCCSRGRWPSNSCNLIWRKSILWVCRRVDNFLNASEGQLSLKYAMRKCVVVSYGDEKSW